MSMKLEEVDPNTLTVEDELLLWRHYDEHLNKVESSLPSVTAIVLLVINVFAFGGKDNMSDFVFFAVPAAALFFLYYIAYQSRVIEILRGFLCYLEDDIARKKKSSAIMWSNIGVMKHYNTNFLCQKFCGFFFALILAPLCIYCFWRMFARQLDQIICPTWFTVAYAIVFLFFSTVFLLDILGNGKVHTRVYEDLKNKEKAIAQNE